MSLFFKVRLHFLLVLIEVSLQKNGKEFLIVILHFSSQKGG